MAQPSSSHHRSSERERDPRSDRERYRSEREADRAHRSSRSHRHHRTISSTTLLLVLSLVLAVLAVMLSLPANQLPAMGTAENAGTGEPKGVWSILTPKRSQQLVTRERDVAVREAEVARREAELLAGAPGGVLPAPAPSPVACPICPSVPMYPPEPAQTIIKEVFKETTEELTPPGWYKESQLRFEDILDRELKIAEREREIGRREEQVNRREHDASRREGWIMEQLVALGNEETVEEHVYDTYDTPRSPPLRRPNKQPFLPIDMEPLEPLIYTESVIETQFKTVTQTQHHTYTMPASTVAGPAPANTRLAAKPTPSPVTVSFSTGIPKTTSVQYVTEEVVEEPVVVEPVVEEEIVEEMPAQVSRRRPPPRKPKHWMGGGW